MKPEPREEPFPIFSLFILIVALFILGSFACTLAHADSLQIFAAEKNRPASVSMFCGECHDGSVAAIPRVNLPGSHPTDKGGIDCLSCHESNDPKPTPWRCCECHSAICGTPGANAAVAHRTRGVR